MLGSDTGAVPGLRLMARMMAVLTRHRILTGWLTVNEKAALEFLVSHDRLKRVR